jgi:hypothetical protein
VRLGAREFEGFVFRNKEFLAAWFWCFCRSLPLQTFLECFVLVGPSKPMPPN